MTITDEILTHLHNFEGLKLKSYLCPAGIWTIGYGNTRYEDGTKVGKGEIITQARAESLFMSVLNKKADELRAQLKQHNTNLTPNQFSALLSFYYNVGPGSPSKSGLFRLSGPKPRPSTLWLLVTHNPNDPLIAKEFMKWVNPGSSFENGLKRRREEEVKIYFS